MAIERSAAAVIDQERLTATWSAAAVGRSEYMPILARRAAHCTAVTSRDSMASEDSSAAAVAAAACIASGGERPAFAWLTGGRRVRSSAASASASASDAEPNGNSGAPRRAPLLVPAHSRALIPS